MHNTASKRLLKIAALFTVILIIILAYFNCLNNPFISDDTAFIKDNKLHSLKGLFSDPQKRNINSFVPATYALTWQIYGDNVRAFHFTNVAIHIANAIIIYFLIINIFGNSLLALIASLIFGVHPINNQVVAWVSGRGYEIFAFFFLLSTLFFIKSSKLRNLKEVLLYFFSIFCFYLSFNIQRASFSLPLILMLINFIQKSSSERISVFFKRTFFLMFPYLIVVLVSIPALLNAGAAKHFDTYSAVAANYHFSIWPDFKRIIIIAKSIFYYIKLLIYPVRLGFYHPGYFEYNPALERFDITALLAFLVCVSASLFAFIKMKKHKELSFGIIIFFVTLIPFTDIVYIHAIVAERYAYLASLGYSIVLSAMLLKIRGSLVKRLGMSQATVLFVVLVSVMILIYGCRTFMKNFDWKDWVTYYSNEVENDPNSKFAHNSLGGTISMSNPKLAIQEFKKAIEIDPKYLEAHYNLGQIYSDLGNFEDAEKELRITISLSPQFAGTYDNLGKVYFKANKLEEAANSFLQAIKLQPEEPLFYNNLGVVYFKMGRKNDALQIFNKALQINPNLEAAQMNIKQISESK